MRTTSFSRILLHSILLRDALHHITERVRMRDLSFRVGEKTNSRAAVVTGISAVIGEVSGLAELWGGGLVCDRAPLGSR